ncbi:MAG TPA: response regulator transcription factor [Ktedonobacteraceae bacterium]|nr:response regulator transcription factor [Ktedonobacteraceae bacterium]
MGCQVLIVDDDTNIQKLLKEVLEFAQFEVQAVNDGIEALAYLEHTRPALILLDLMMPRMDGQTFVRELERRGLSSTMPVIVLTAHIYAQPQVERMGIDYFMHKPFHVNELLQQVRTLLAKYRHIET